jgi:nucleotide-binding universal stress UspA family protein
VAETVSARKEGSKVATIVVGVDGSESARQAARFALEEARIRNARLRLVSVWHIPLAVYASPLAPPALSGLNQDLEALARDAIEATVADLGSAKGVEIDRVVRQGQPAAILVEEAANADLLVVGSRGLGGFRGLLLGSVSQQCAEHASCPVVILRAGKRTADDG